MEVVAVLGASNDTSRYSYKAMEMLQEYGHRAIPVHPREDQVLGEKVFKDIAELKKSGEKIDTLTMYVGHAISSKYQADILELAPKRVIFNPGAENPVLEDALRGQGVEVLEACTLVMLRTSQF
jgi:uncharacterized protein